MTQDHAKYGAGLAVAMLLAAVLFATASGPWPFVAVLLAFLAGGIVGQIGAAHMFGKIIP